MRKVLLQMADGKHLGLLDLVANHHAKYAEAHGMIYASYRGRVELGLPASWSRIPLVLNHFAGGADVVVWLDADAVVVDFSQDITAACPFGVGMSHYDRPFSHHQAGVFVAHRSAKTVDFFERVLQSSRQNDYDVPGPFGKWEQQPMNEIGRELGIIATIGQRWNYIPAYADAVAKVAVYAYHGYSLEERYANVRRHVDGRGP